MSKKLIIPCILLLLGCQPQKATQGTAQPTADDGWITLFDGSSTDGWREFNGTSLPANWIVEDGALKSLGSGNQLGGDLVYGAREFDYFDLTFEWKISEGGNSGVFYHVVEGDQYKAPYETAPEYQVIDDLGFSQELEDWQSVGADYAMYFGDPANKPVRPAGEWNNSRIYFSKQRAEYWLNDKKMFEFVPWSEDWQQRRNSGKWDDYPDYGKAKSGLIGIQDHGSFIWFKNIKIKPL